MSAVTGGETQRAAVAPGTRPPLAVPRRLLRMRSDAALAERFAAGDEAAFDVLYERHRPVVLAVSMGVLGTPQDAEDATQETFSALAVALRTKPPIELRPWLIRVARNASIDTTRRRRHRLLTLDGEIPDVPARPASSGHAELAVVLDGIRELPEGQRMALLMRELGGHSYAEIADFLESDEEAVKGLIARARVGLRTYREATELPCATARTTIAAEPDGRRYDKTIRRHLRTCASCRSYRSALRDDAKALRAALPIQAGGVATGGLSTGMLTAAKGTILSYGITQAATTCAASACAVGAIGGLVFVAPIRPLGLPPILPALKLSQVHRHTVRKAPPRHVVKVVSHSQAPVIQSTPEPASESSSVPAARTPAHGAVTVHHHHRRPTVTVVKLPPLHPTATTPVATPIVATAPAPATQTTPTPASAPTGTTPTGDSGSTAGAGNGPVGHGWWHNGQGSPQHSPGSSQSDQGSSQSGQGTWQHGQSGWRGQSGGAGTASAWAAPATPAAPAAPTAKAGAQATPATSSNAAPGTVSTSSTPPGRTWGGGQPGRGHHGTWRQSIVTANSTQPSTAPGDGGPRNSNGWSQHRQWGAVGSGSTSGSTTAQQSQWSGYGSGQQTRSGWWSASPQQTSAGQGQSAWDSHGTRWGH